VLPEPALPYTALALRDSACRSSLAAFNASGEHRFDQPPPHGEIGITLRQCPDRVEMVRQHDDSIDRESVSRARISECTSKLIDPIDEEIRSTIGEINSEKETAAGNEITPVARHLRILDRNIERSQGR
jgi:hypothetical protein